MKPNSGSFVKGQKSWNKIGTTKICTICFTEYAVRGIKRRETSLYCSMKCRGISLQGKPSPMKGRISSPETREKQRQAKLGIRGKDHWNYKNGSGSERHRDMQRDEYKQWRKAVFERDNYTCQTCKATGVYLQADHIKQWAFFPELRYDLNNGRTLCIDCHEKTDSFPIQLRRRIVI